MMAAGDVTIVVERRLNISNLEEQVEGQWRRKILIRGIISNGYLALSSSVIACPMLMRARVGSVAH